MEINMKNTMQELIIVLRYERLKKIKEMQDSGITIDKNRFVYVKKFTIDENYHSFEVRVSGSELYFYVSKSLFEDSSTTYTNSYFSIFEIYRAIMKLPDQDLIVITQILTKGLVKESTLFYEGSKFEINTLNLNMANELSIDIIKIDDINIGIKDFLYLLSIVQVKSNAFFSENSKTPEYKNGILNLLLVLINMKSNHDLLQSKGWEYNNSELLFAFKRPTISFIYVLVTDENQKIIQEFIDEMKKYSVITVEFDILYNSFKTSLKQEINNFSDVLIDDKNHPLYNLIRVIDRDIKKGLLDCSDEDDIKCAMPLEIKKISGKKYFYVVERKTSTFKYYLTEKEKGDILK